MDSEIKALRHDLYGFTQEMRTLVERLRLIVMVGQNVHCGGGSSGQMSEVSGCDQQAEKSDDEDSNYIEAVEHHEGVRKDFDVESLSSVEEEFQDSTSEFAFTLTESDSAATTSDLLRDAILQMRSSGDHVDGAAKGPPDPDKPGLFKESADVRAFKPEDVEVWVQFRKITVHAQHLETPGGTNVLVQQYYRTYSLPDSVLPQTVTTQFNEDGMLIIEAFPQPAVEHPSYRMKSKF